MIRFIPFEERIQATLMVASDDWSVELGQTCESDCNIIYAVTIAARDGATDNESKKYFKVLHFSE